MVVYTEYDKKPQIQNAELINVEVSGIHICQ